MKAQDITAAASQALFDDLAIRWPLPELYRYIYRGQAIIIEARPDASSTTVVVQLKGGSRQSLPTNCSRFIGCVRNMGAGTKPGRSIQQTQRAVLDEWIPGWHSATKASVIEQYVYDQLRPREFEVYPPAVGVDGSPSSVYIEIAHSLAPNAVTGPNDDLVVRDEYFNVLFDLVMWRALSKDSEGQDLARAQQHAQSAANLLGLSTQAVMKAGRQEEGESA